VSTETITRLDWTQPRRVDVWWWTQIRDAVGISETTGEPIVVREGTVSWNQDGSGHYRVSISYEREGVGLGCWPSFYALSDAQDFIERLMDMPVDEADAIHGQGWGSTQ
jgi:hypothetical protein